MFTAMWIAYPLYKSTCYGTTDYNGSWVETPGIATNYQINIWDHSYNVYLGETEYSDSFTMDGREYYSRGHQIPKADRQFNEIMVQQTYYAINSTPQIQNKFNGGIWGALETAIRNVVIDKNETVYVVTGPVFNKVGENKEVTWILPRGDSKRCPVPNYYWKAVLRVKTDAGGNVTSASSCAFWFDHQQYSGSEYTGYAFSVNQIEEWMGLDLFANLPDNLEETVESNNNWSTFKNFK